jgi:hypothetical protein
MDEGRYREWQRKRAADEEIIGAGGRRCARCRRMLLPEHFRADPKGIAGLSSWCRECSREHGRTWRAKNPEKMAAYRARQREKYVAARGERVCSECGGELPKHKGKVCSASCREKRYRRLHPEAYKAKQHRKYLRRKARRASA